jgi:hypothetical protein
VTTLTRAAVVIAFAVALLSGAKDYRATWHWLSGQRAQFVHFSETERRQEPGVAQLLPVDAFEFFRSHLGKGDRYVVEAEPKGFQTGVDAAQATRIFSRYYLLPAIQVVDPARADFVISVGLDPHVAGVPLARVWKFGGGQYYVGAVRK